MPILALRTQQTTNTVGTGTVALNTVAAGRRSWLQAFGAGTTRTGYVISGASFFEIGLGDYDGGTPGTLSRVTVLASSNADALVSLPVGVADVFTYLDPEQRGVITSTGAVALTVADMGNILVWSGTVTNTVTLPAVAAVPNGRGYLIINRGTATVTIDPSGAEMINGAATLAVLTGDAAECYQSGGAWHVALAKSGTTFASLTVTGAATVGTTLGVTGASTLASATVTAALTVGTTLGVTGAATLSSTLAVTGTATAANGTTGSQVVNISQFPATLAETGTRTAPGGFIEKWGRSSIANGAATTVTFATAFPTACDNVSITQNATGLGNGSADWNVVSRSTTGFVVEHGAASAVPIFWRAIGR